MLQFVEDAVAGDWICKACVEPEKNYHWYKEAILLDVLAWQAVGKMRNTNHYVSCNNPEHTHHEYPNGEPCYCPECEHMEDGWKSQMHRFIDHLCDGLSIEEALGKIL